MNKLKDILRSMRYGRLNKKILALAIPAVFTMINHTIVMVTDTAMVGRLGKTAIGAAGLGGWITFTTIAVFFGVSAGVQILTARKYGEKNYSGIKSVLRLTIFGTVIICIFVTIVGWFFADGIISLISKSPDMAPSAAEFLRYRSFGVTFFVLTMILRGYYDGIGLTYISMIATSASTLSNVLLNWVFIYGNWGAPALGVKGAAIASSMASFPAVLIQFGFLMHPKIRELRAKSLIGLREKYSEIIREINHLASPISLDNLLLHGSFLILFKIAGIAGDLSVASSNVLISVMSISFMPGNAFGIAATTLLGQAIGAGKPVFGYRAVLHCGRFSAIVMGILGALFIIFNKSLLGLFTIDLDVINDSAFPLLIVSLAQITDAYHMVYAASLRTAGYVYWVLMIYFIISYVFMLPIAYFTGIVLGWGTTGIWCGVVFWLTTLAVLFVHRFSLKKWMTADPLKLAYPGL